MKCPNCGLSIQSEMKKDYTKPLFAILLVLLVVFFLVGFRLYGVNKSLESSIERLEKKMEYYESLLLDYEKAIEEVGKTHPKRHK